MIRYQRRVAAASLLLGLVLAAETADAQRRAPRRRDSTIVIRGTVPTPQVVTVRPREVPAYSRQVLVPNYYDRDFWPSVLPGYQVVSRRLITGNQALDSATAAATRDVQREGGAAYLVDTTQMTPAERARMRELQEIRRELMLRQQRVDSIRRAADTLYRPMSERPLAPGARPGQTPPPSTPPTSQHTPRQPFPADNAPRPPGTASAGSPSRR